MIWNERASPRAARACTGRRVMSSPPNRMRPASGASSPEIWLISVVLPAPFGPITACSSPGRTSSVTSSVTRRPPKFLREVLDAQDRLSHGTSSAAARQTPSRPPRREHRDQHQQRPEDHLPVLGEARQPFLDQQEGGGADDRAVERADAAEDHHDEQFARALPRHVGRADELGRVGEQEAGEPADRAGDHVGDELVAVDLEADGRRCAAGSRARRDRRGRSARRPARGTAGRRRAGRAGDVIERAVVAEDRKAGERRARADGQAVVAAIGRERARGEDTPSARTRA